MNVSANKNNPVPEVEKKGLISGERKNTIVGSDKISLDGRVLKSGLKEKR